MVMDGRINTITDNVYDMANRILSSGHAYVLNGERVIGHNERILAASDYLSRYKSEENLPAVIAISGAEGSGRTMLAKTIMDDNHLPYSVIDLDIVEKAEKPVRVFESLNHVTEGIILRGYDGIKDKGLFIAVHNYLENAKEVVSGHSPQYVSTIILTERRVQIPFGILKRTCSIPIVYNNLDYVMMFITFCKESGYDVGGTGITMDHKILELICRELYGNIHLYKMWVKGILCLKREEVEYLNGNMNIIKTLIHDTVNLGKIRYRREQEDV